jgi:hypothetical protein
VFEVSYGRDGFDELMLRAERMRRFDLIEKVAEARDEADRHYFEALKIRKKQEK